MAVNKIAMHVLFHIFREKIINPKQHRACLIQKANITFIQTYSSVITNQTKRNEKIKATTNYSHGILTVMLITVWEHACSKK